VPDGPEARQIAATIPYYKFKGIDRFYDVGGEPKSHSQPTPQVYIVFALLFCCQCVNYASTRAQRTSDASTALRTRAGMTANVEMFALCVDILAQRYANMSVDCIGGLDARGFLLGPPLALALKKPFFMLRKKGKMPDVIEGQSYSKEYASDDASGADTLCIPRRAVAAGTRVLLIDDLIATGGTMLAAVDLVKQQVRSRSASRVFMFSAFHSDSQKHHLCPLPLS
jgi:adenine phosphoribosyltransferase